MTECQIRNEENLPYFIFFFISMIFTQKKNAFVFSENCVVMINW